MHTTGQFIEFIDRVFGDVKVTGHGDRCNLTVICPVCRERKGSVYHSYKLAIKLDNHLTKCWVCGYRSRSIAGLIKRFKPEYLQQYLSEFNGAAYAVNDEELPDITLTLPPGFVLLAEQTEDSPWYVRQAIHYLQSRGLSWNDLWYWKLGTTFHDARYRFRVIVPSFGKDGSLNFFTTRAFKEQKPKYLNPEIDKNEVVFNELNIDWNEELTVVEGPFDLIKCNDNATCLLGRELSEESLLFQRIVSNNTSVVLCLDSDASKQSLTIARSLWSYGVSVKVLRNPPGVKDPGEMTKTQFAKNLGSATLVSESDYLLSRINELV